MEQAVETLAWWLVDAQTGFGVQDAKGIVNILRYGSPRVYYQGPSK